MNELINEAHLKRRSFGVKTCYAMTDSVNSVQRLAAGVRPERHTHRSSARSTGKAVEYAVDMYFIGTRDSSINEKRVHEGIIYRWEPCRTREQISRLRAAGMENMRRSIKNIDKVTLIDGTRELKTVAVVTGGAAERCTSRLPSWAKNVLGDLKL